ncbi:DUF2804 domain-containing protein [Georgenia wangjunii]|uniref:DUF2804 domain-containing protein n=1 Tax=Georgenia wangjunii TaxID=3117730 RepID=UPI002F26A536
MDEGRRAPQREITERVDLCLPSGELNPAAVGWTRAALHRANLRRGNARGLPATWSRTKTWEHCVLMNDRHVVTVIASALNFAGVHEVWVLDRRTGEEVSASVTVPLARDTHMPAVVGTGPVRAHGTGLTIAVDPAPTLASPDALWLRARTDRIHLDVLVAPPAGTESLGVVVPWSERLFQYSLTTAALPVSGALTVDGVRHELGEGTWAVLDHGRGRWPYSVLWNRGAGSGLVDGVRTGLQLGGRWTDGTGASESALSLDGRLHRIAEDLSWAYDATDVGAPWFVTGERADVRLTPFRTRTAAVSLGMLSARTDRAFGTWTGWLRDDGGTKRRVDGLVGWAELVVNRW